MATYVYFISSGELYSWNQNDSDPIAPPATLAQQGMASKTALPKLDETHVWDAPTKNVVTIAAAKSIPTLKEFWNRFTVPERQGIENLNMTGSQGAKNQISAFLRYAQSSGHVDCNDPYVLSSVQQLETAGVIAVGRAAQIVI